MVSFFYNRLVIHPLKKTHTRSTGMLIARHAPGHIAKISK
jgi:hypothetical protein